MEVPREWIETKLQTHNCIPFHVTHMCKKRQTCGASYASTCDPTMIHLFLFVFFCRNSCKNTALYTSSPCSPVPGEGGTTHCLRGTCWCCCQDCCPRRIGRRSAGLGVLHLIWSYLSAYNKSKHMINIFN